MVKELVVEVAEEEVWYEVVVEVAEEEDEVVVEEEQVEAND